ncbi:HHE domain-containing protein [Plectosphaerella plurivora]|uniref:HHE domain-containing protein n=1 Tax=Plectosphaerella plurivora TaxID=936078 RepID=A0A9P9ABS0_9PEZI|nr:HHE domain-containing protein [Plectosphaerella plurivora]
MDQVIGIASISDVIKDDHRTIEELYSNIVNAADTKTQSCHQDALVWSLARQCISEELIIFPALEAYVEDGKIIAQKDELEHEKIKEHLKLFESAQAGDAEFIHTLEALMELVNQHVSFEERNDLVSLEAGLRASESEELAGDYQRMRKLIPVRGEADGAMQRGFDDVAALFATPMDELRTSLKKLP